MLRTEAMHYLDRAFPFEVYKEQLRRCNEDTAYFGLFRTDNNEQVSSKTVTDRYVPHTTEDIKKITVDCIGAFEEQGIDEHLSGVRAWFNKGHYVCIAPPRGVRKRVHVRDAIYPRVNIYAPLGGQGSVLINCGWWREKCGNLAQPVCVEGIKLNFRHTSSLEHNIESLDKTILLDSWSKLRVKVREMERNSVKFNDAMDIIFSEPRTSRNKTRHTNRIEAIAKRIMNEREYHTQTGKLEGLNFISGWELYNGVQGYYQHDAPMRSAITRSGDEQLHELVDGTSWIRMLKTKANKHVIAAEELALAS